MEILNKEFVREQELRDDLDKDYEDYIKITIEKKELEQKRRELDMKIRKAQTYLREFRKANNINYCNELKCSARITYLNKKCTRHLMKQMKEARDGK